MREVREMSDCQVEIEDLKDQLFTLREAILAFREDDMGSRSDCFCVQAQVPGKDHWPTCKRLLEALVTLPKK